MSKIKELRDKLTAFFASDEVKPLLEDGKEYHVVEKEKDGETPDPAPVKDDTTPEPDAPENAETDETEESEKPDQNSEGGDAQAASATKKPVVQSDAQKKLIEFRDKAIATEAEAFVKAEIQAGRMVPAQKAAFSSLFIQAAKDDFDSPLAQGSRVERLKSIQKGQIPNGLTQEQVDAEANKVLFAATSDQTAMQAAASKQVDSYVATVTPKAKLEVVNK